MPLPGHCHVLRSKTIRILEYIEWKELDLSNPDEDGDFYLSGGKNRRRIVHLPQHHQEMASYMRT